MEPGTEQNGAADSGQNRVFGLSLVLVAIILFVFMHSREFPFLGYHDLPAVVAHPVVGEGLSAQGVAWAFSNPHAGSWAPLSTLTHMLDVSLHGDWAGGHRQTNLVLHTLNALLLFWALLLMTGAAGRSVLAAGLFAVHPTRVEPVVWIAGRPELLGGTFFFLTLLAYTAYARRPGLVCYLGVVLALLGGLLSAPLAVLPLPLILLLLDWWPLRRVVRGGARRLLLEKLPLLLLALGACLIVLRMETGTAELGVGHVLAAYLHHVWHFIWPVELAVHYPAPEPAPWAMAGGGLLLVVVSALVFLFRRRRCLPVGWFWFLLMLAPAALLARADGAALADGAAYLPYVGLLLLAVWGGHALLARSELGQVAARPVATLLLAVLMVLAWWQAGFWRDAETVLRRALETTQGNAAAHALLGDVLTEDGRTVEAVPHYEAALRLAPARPEHHHRLGVALLDLGQVEQALLRLEEAVRLAPAAPVPRLDYAEGLMRAGRDNEAIAQLEEVLRLEPGNEAAQALLASARENLPE